MAEVDNKTKVNKIKPKIEFRNGWTIPVVALVFALAFTAVMVYVIVLQANRNKYYAEIEAEVVSVADYNDYEGDEHHEIYVKYTVDGEKYRQRLNYWNEELEIGDKTIIKYDIRNPKIIKTTDTFTVLIIIEVSISTVLYVVTAWFIIRKIRFDKKLKKKMLKREQARLKKEQPKEA
jgi:energy-coupling factor transporter transmembrane protein EcfT